METEPQTSAHVDFVASAFAKRGFSLIETHISRVFLGPRDVYKTKRPVNLGFLDYVSLAAREHACLAEVALNARLAPAVYKGVVGLVSDARGELQLLSHAQAAHAPVLDWAVHMERLSDAARLDVRLAAGQLTVDEVEQVAAQIARFHDKCRCDEVTASYGAPACIAKNVEENFAQTRDLIADHLTADESARIERFQRDFLRDRASLFEARVRDGFVRDGHGDLRLEHVYRTELGEHVIIDCIEFNERFRFADVCADLAFLSMDLRAHGRPDLAELLLAAYAHASRDYGCYDLIDFYESYRAYVRGKVSSMLAHDASVDETTRNHARTAARRYFLLALAAAERPLAPARLVVCMGNIASGKSTLASALARTIAAPVLSADLTRKELLGVSAYTAVKEAAFAGAYADDVSERVYDLLRARAEHVLRANRSVVIDAGCRALRERMALRALASRLDVEVLFVECICSRAVAMQRLNQRAASAHVSDGRAEIYDALCARFEPTSELPAAIHLALNTEQPPPQAVASVLRALGADASS